MLLGTELERHVPSLVESVNVSYHGHPRSGFGCSLVRSLRFYNLFLMVRRAYERRISSFLVNCCFGS